MAILCCLFLQSNAFASVSSKLTTNHYIDRPKPPVDISGVVIDAKGEPIPGVGVGVKDTRIAVVTDGAGKFVIKNVENNATLVFTSIGYKTQEIEVNGRTTINVTLTEDTRGLSEVVVIGYGTASRKDVTGAISSVKAVQLENENPQSVADILKGNIAGLSVSMNTSAKGGGDLLVRGKSTLTAGNSPLIVLDGIIYFGALSDINPNDIETVDVLKDASSLAVYGAKAATGVVAITTKKGKGGKPSINLNTNFGIAQLAQDMRPYSGEEFLKWRADVARSGGATASYLYDDPRNLSPGVTLTQWLNGQTTSDPVDLWLNRLGLVANEKANYFAGRETDWYDKIFRTGQRQDHTLSVSGSKEEFNYYMSIGYQKNENIVDNGQFSTVRFRTNLESQVAKFLTIGANIQFADRDESAIEADWGQLINLSPYGDMYNADGSLRRIPTDDNGLNARNPFLNQTYNSRMDKTYTLFGSLYGKVNLPFGITYQLNFSPALNSWRRFDHQSSQNPNVTTPGGVASRQNETQYNWQVDNLIKWNRTFDKIHNFDVTLLANAEKFQTWWTNAANQTFAPSDVLGYHNLGSGTTPTTVSEDKVYTGSGLMARLNYSLKQRYFLTLSLRRDGYSVFGVNYKEATFPAAAIAWTFTEENFAKKVSWLNYGKIRLSYGINGNRDLRDPGNGTVDPYAALALLNVDKYQLVNNSGTVTPVNAVFIGGRLPNPNLRWEETKSLNLGLDFSVLNNRIGGSIEFFDKTTEYLLVRQTVSSVSGYSFVNSNLAQIKNKGMDLSLTSKNMDRPNFKWNTSLNLSLSRNKIVRLALPTDDPANGWFIGKDINVIWNYEIAGVWQENEIAEANKFNKGIKPGDFKLVDVDGNYIYNDADKKFLGFTTPRYIIALRSEFNIFKNFDVSFQLLSNWGQMKQDNQPINQPGSVGFARMNSYVNNYWTPSNPTNKYARLNSGLSGTSFNVFRDNSFIRLNNVAVAYTLPKDILNKIRVKGLKVYANVNNAAVYTRDWEFWDPENNGPTPRYYTFGLNVSL